MIGAPRGGSEDVQADRPSRASDDHDHEGPEDEPRSGHPHSGLTAKGAGPQGCGGGSTSPIPATLSPSPRGLARYFEGIDTDLTTPIGVFDTHKVTGCLSCTTLAAALATLLGGGD